MLTHIRVSTTIVGYLLHMRDLDRRVDERWHSVEDLCEHLGIARDTVYRWIDRRGLPAHKIGKLWKFRLSEVDAWVVTGGADEARVEPQQSKRGDER
jgi:excisionase family DNA binding protein